MDEETIEEAVGADTKEEDIAMMKMKRRRENMRRRRSPSTNSIMKTQSQEDGLNWGENDRMSAGHQTEEN